MYLETQRLILRNLKPSGESQEGHLCQAVLGYDGMVHDDLLFSLRADAR